MDMLIWLYWSACCLVHQCHYVLSPFQCNSRAKPSWLLAAELLLKFSLTFPSSNQQFLCPTSWFTTALLSTLNVAPLKLQFLIWILSQAIQLKLFNKTEGEKKNFSIQQSISVLLPFGWLQFGKSRDWRLSLLSVLHPNAWQSSCS